MKLWIDADAVPRDVKEIAFRAARRLSLETTLVANQRLYVPPGTAFVSAVRVEGGPDVADRYIVEHAEAGDVVVTSDIPLASRALAKGANVLGPTGKAFTKDAIGMALAMRDLNQHLRETGESRGLNAGFTARDRSAFLQALDETVVRAKRG